MIAIVISTVRITNCVANLVMNVYVDKCQQALPWGVVETLSLYDWPLCDFPVSIV